VEYQFWVDGIKNKSLDIARFVGDITSFCNAFMALSAKNEIAIISSMQKGTSFIFPTPVMDQFRTNSSEYIAAMDAAITAFFEDEFSKLQCMSPPCVYPRWMESGE
jgi:hypothetical protein